jgi:hypothetical protein
MDITLTNIEDFKIIKERMAEYISDGDIRRHLGEDAINNVIKYSELKNYNNIEELLPTDKSYRIILIENEYNSGHWVLLMRYKYKDTDYLEFFNSYGMMPTTSLDFINKIKQKLFGEDIKYLDKLLNKAKKNYKIIYSSKRYQKLHPEIATCGRHTLLRVLMMLYYNMSLYDYIEFMDCLKNKYKYPDDVIVSMLIK